MMPIAEHDVVFRAIRAQGKGGQNINKVSTAVQLTFDIGASSLPPLVKYRLRQLDDRRVTADGIIIIKAQEHRTQERNKEEALARLHALIRDAARTRIARIPTNPTRGSKQRRITAKKFRGARKALRGTVRGER